MCGRYRLSRRKQLIAEYFETDNEVDWEPRYNIAPSQPVGIIRQDPSRPERHFSLARWGLIPSWATDTSIGFKTINARAETVANKPAFRDAFMNRRCCFPPTVSSNGCEEGKTNSPSTSACRTIACSHLLGCGINGETRPVLSSSLARF